MNSLHRLIRVLDIFEEERGVLSADDIFARLGYSRSTTYRYLKILSDAGLLTSWHGIGYTFGPRIIEMNAIIAARDPLLTVSRPEMRTVSRAVPGVVRLCRRFKDKVLCVHSETSPHVAVQDTQLGRARPMVGGAASRVILSGLGAQQLRRYYDTHGPALHAAGLGGSLGEVRSRLKTVRDQGYHIERTEGGAGVTTIAAPLLDGAGAPVGALTLDVANRSTPHDQVPAYTRHVLDASQNICRAIAA